MGVRNVGSPLERPTAARHRRPNRLQKRLLRKLRNLGHVRGVSMATGLATDNRTSHGQSPHGEARRIALFNESKS